MSKFDKFLIILSIILLAILIYIIADKYDYLENNNIATLNNKFYSDGSKLAEPKDEIVVTDVEELSENSPIPKIYKVGEEKAFAYELDYYPRNVREFDSMRSRHLSVNDTLKKDKDSYASDQIYLILRESYPIISLNEMGLKTEKQAYQAVQLAIWEISRRTGESSGIGRELTSVNSIRKDYKYDYIDSIVYDKATNLVSIVEKYCEDKTLGKDFNVLSTFILDSEKSELKTEDDYCLIGAYKYRQESAIITEMNVNAEVIEGEKVPIEITDSNGVSIKDFLKNDEFYIKIPHSFEGKIKFKIYLKSKAPQLVTYTNNSKKYLVNTYIENESENEYFLNIT